MSIYTYNNNGKKTEAENGKTNATMISKDIL